MAKKIYIGVSAKARRVKKAYVGVNGQARRIKKAYIGIGGVARPCFSTGAEYWGETSQPLAAAAVCRASSSTSYAVFASDGDAKASTPVSSKVTAYNASLVRSLAEDFTYGRYSFMAAGIGEYVIFAGGMSSATYYNKPEVYNGSLTKVTATSTYDTPYSGAGAKGENHSFIIGGYYGAYINAYNSSLTYTKTPTNLQFSNMRYLAATALGEYVIYGGGYGATSDKNSQARSKMCAVNSSLTVTDVADLSNARCQFSAARAGNYAIFGGSNNITLPDVYNTSLTHSNAADFSTARNYAPAATVGDFAIFAGGYNSTSGTTAADIYDKSLTHTNDLTLKYSHKDGAAAEIGNFAIFGGGYADNSTTTDSAEAVTI